MVARSPIIFEKLLAFAMTAAVTIFLDLPTLVFWLILIGHGHIFVAYLYQYKAGKFTKNGIVLFLIAAAVIVGSFYSFMSFQALALITGIYFLFHMLWDELYLMRMPMELERPAMHVGRTLEMLPAILIYSARLIDSLLYPEILSSDGLSGPMAIALILSSVILLLYAGLVSAKGYVPDFKSCFFLGCSLVLVVLGSLSLLPKIHAIRWISIMVFYHYFIWYLHYYMTLPSGKPRLTYLGRVTVINVVLLAGFLLLGSRGVGILFFNEAAFYIWTLLHLLTSTRKGDLKALFQWPNLK